MMVSKRKVLAIVVLACIGLLAYGAQAERPERDVARHGPASFNVWHGDVPHDRARFSSRGSKYYRERYFYRHGKSNFMRRRHRTFVLFARSGRGYHSDHRFIRRGHRSIGRYGHRGLYRHGKSSFMRRRHRTFAFYGYPGRGRYFGYSPGCYGHYPRHRVYLGRRR